MNQIKNFLVIVLVCILAISISNCNSPSETEAPVNTLAAVDNIDPCAPDVIQSTGAPLKNLMDRFDDGADIAANSPHEQLTEPIADLQALRREAEELEVPICLENLKTSQIDYMNSVIDTLLMFLSLQDEEVIMVGIEISDELRLMYESQLSEIFGTEP